MINKVKTELGPDLATPGRVVTPFAPSPADELRQLSRLLA